MQDVQRQAAHERVRSEAHETRSTIEHDHLIDPFHASLEPGGGPDEPQARPNAHRQDVASAPARAAEEKRNAMVSRSRYARDASVSAGGQLALPMDEKQKRRSLHADDRFRRAKE